jgi:hypothetical protein
MWILNWIPSWLFVGISVAGIIGYVLSFLLDLLPFKSISAYRTLLQLVSMALIAIGCFVLGLVYDNDSFLNKVKEMEAKVAAAETKSKEENVKIVEKYSTKDQANKTKTESVIKYIDREVVKYDNSCVIPKEFIKAHNDAAKEPK